jgi:diphthamide biosynthesis enzyme Dph1/Dph2-like protein
MRQARIESHITNKLLMRRYAVVQKARDADVFGILVGTLGVGLSTPSCSPYHSPDWLNIQPLTFR